MGPQSKEKAKYDPKHQTWQAGAVNKLWLSGLLLCMTSSIAQANGLRDPEGSILVGVSGGGQFSDEFNYGTVGLSFGYAVIDGVVPGVRGNIFFGDLTGGELAATLWLTPPLRGPVVPFVVGEFGHAWQNFNDVELTGLLYGAGAGLHLGSPGDSITARAGLIYRYYDIGNGQSAFSPIISFGFRF